MSTLITGTALTLAATTTASNATVRNRWARIGAELPGTQQYIVDFARLSKLSYLSSKTDLQNAIERAEVKTPELKLSRNLKLIDSRVSSIGFARAYAIVFDEKDKELIIVVRGTDSLSAVYTDLAVAGRDFPHIDGFQVHGGIYESAQEILETVKKTLKNSEILSSVERIACTGHSLGGGVAGVLCLMFMHDPDLSRFRKRSIAYGSPPCISHKDRNAAIDNQMISVVNKDDIIPRMRLEQIRFLRSAVATYSDKGSGQLLHFVTKNSFKSHEFAESDFERNLVLPGGRVLLINNQTKLIEVDMTSSKKMFQSGSENMFLTTNIFKDHACSSYVSNLSSLKVLE
jgi:hypothetical protein